HIELAMCEVEQLHDAEDHRVAERNERVERAEHDPVQELLKEDVEDCHRPAGPSANLRTGTGAKTPVHDLVMRVSRYCGSVQAPPLPSSTTKFERARVFSGV